MSAFYTPGLIPKDYKRDDELVIEVSQVDSPLSHIPYDLVNDARFCEPNGKSASRFGPTLIGEQWHPTFYHVRID